MKKMSWFWKTVLLLGLISCQEPVDDETDNHSAKFSGSSAGLAEASNTEGAPQLPEELSVKVMHQETSYTIELSRYSVRSPDFRAFTAAQNECVDADNNGFPTPDECPVREILPLPEPRTYRGKVLGNPFWLASGVVDKDGMLYLSIWNGRHREWLAEVSVFDKMNQGEVVYNPGPITEISQGKPAAPWLLEGDSWHIPEPGPNFHNFLYRVNAYYHNIAFEDAGKHSIINALAQIENNLNEFDFTFSQIGLRFDLGRAYIQIENERYKEDIATYWYPHERKKTNYHAAFYRAWECLAWVNHSKAQCTTRYRPTWGWQHEIGHNLGLMHEDGLVDAGHHVMGGLEFDTQFGLMQANIALGRVQLPERYNPPENTVFKALPQQSPMLPAAFVDYITTYANESGSVNPLLNDYDSNGDILSVGDYDATSMNGGQVFYQNNLLHYVPPKDFIGPDVFTYTASDGELKTKQKIQVLVLPKGVASRWDIDGDASSVVDKGAYHENLTVMNADLKDSLVPGVEGFGLAAAARVAERASTDPFGDRFIPHLYDPGSKSFTASIWFKYNPVDDTHRLIVGKSRDFAEYYNPLQSPLKMGGWIAAVRGNDLYLGIGLRNKVLKNNAREILVPNAIVKDKWHHLVMVIDRENQLLRGYLDGQEVGTPAGIDSDSPIAIARSLDAWYTGKGAELRVGEHTNESSGTSAWDNLKIFHRAITEKEIQSLFTSKRLPLRAPTFCGRFGKLRDHYENFADKLICEDKQENYLKGVDQRISSRDLDTCCSCYFPGTFCPLGQIHKEQSRCTITNDEYAQLFKDAIASNTSALNCPMPDLKDVGSCCEDNPEE